MEEQAKRERVTALGLPRDVMLGDVLVSFVGNREVWVGNYRSLLLYTDTQIKIQAKGCRVKICGQGLRICCYTGEEMRIRGRICTLEFLA